MINGAGGLLLYLWVLFGFIAIAISLVVSLLQRRVLIRIQRFSLPVRHTLLWCLALMPYLIGLYIAALTLVPSLEHMFKLSIDHCHLHGDAHGHLCWAHTPVFVLTSWQGLIAAAFAVLAGWSLAKTFYRGLRHHHYSRLLTNLAESNQGIHHLESDVPSAFTVGLLRPRVLVSRALTEGLSSAEMAIVQRHEFAHQTRRDPLRLWIFGSLLGVFMPSVAKRFYRAMELTLEQIADATVAAEIKDPLFIAETLVKVNRMTTRFFAAQPLSAACHFGGSVLEERILQLLNGTHQSGFPVLKTLLVLGTLLSLSLGAADGTHHLIEALLHSPIILFLH